MEIPLTSFVDFVLKSGSPKMTSAKKIKDNIGVEYDPISDYYKRFRDAVIKLHKDGLDKKRLTGLIGDVPRSKAANYGIMLEGYKKFMGAKNVTWFKPPRKFWKHGTLEIPINPELGLSWNDQKYLIKLYLKAEKPSKDRFSSILALMKKTLPGNDFEYGLLDVRNSKLYLYEDEMLYLIPLVEGEAQSLEAILNRI